MSDVDVAAVRALVAREIEILRAASIRDVRFADILAALDQQQREIERLTAEVSVYKQAHKDERWNAERYQADLAAAKAAQAQAERERDNAREEFAEARNTSYLERAEQAEQERDAYIRRWQDESRAHDRYCTLHAQAEARLSVYRSRWADVENLDPALADSLAATHPLEPKP